MNRWQIAQSMVKNLEPRGITGTVDAVTGLSIKVVDLPVAVGTRVRFQAHGAPVLGEVTGFDHERAIVMALGTTNGVTPGMEVSALVDGATVRVGDSLLGRVINGLGEPIDGKGPLGATIVRSIIPPPISALHRAPIQQPLPTGIRVIDSMLTLGKGQRIGIFSGPGVGKSTLLATIASNTDADMNVIGLIGERGREVSQFIDHAIGPERLKRSVVVVATSDESPLLRVRAALVTATVAEYFRSCGADVMLMMDSVTRLAQAQRQISLASGEHPATRGFPPSVFAMLPALIERAGRIQGEGSITGLYTVLVEGDDLTEPVADTMRGVLDGHLVLSRRLASRGHFPAIDPLESVSRLADEVCDPNHIDSRRSLTSLLAAWQDAEELITIGAYAKGSDPKCDVAIAMKDAIDAYLQQAPDEQTSYPETCRRLVELAAVSKQVADQQAAPATTEMAALAQQVGR
jgi:flagellum-specific ATP synthase